MAKNLEAWFLRQEEKYNLPKPLSKIMCGGIRLSVTGYALDEEEKTFILLTDYSSSGNVVAVPVVKGNLKMPTDIVLKSALSCKLPDIAIETVFDKFGNELCMHAAICVVEEDGRAEIHILYDKEDYYPFSWLMSKGRWDAAVKS